MHAVLNDVRYACRTLLASPASTFIAVVALTLGIGANSAIFSVVNSVLLHPLPYASPERLVILWEANPSKGISEFYVAPSNYKDWMERSRSFELLAAFRPHPAILGRLWGISPLFEIEQLAQAALLAERSRECQTPLV